MRMTHTPIEKPQRAKRPPSTTPQNVTRVEIDFVKQTMTLWDDAHHVATFRPERTGFDLNIVAYDPLEHWGIDVPTRDLSYYDTEKVPQRDLSYYDNLEDDD